MAEGPGKYDKLATWVRERAKAQGVVVVVIGGDKGHGFSIQLPGTATADDMVQIAAMLREVANQVEVDAQRRRS